MQITRIILSEYQQFEFLDVDLVYPKDHPNANKPLDKICLIGKNGTGKTTLLRLINGFLLDMHAQLWIYSITDSDFISHLAVVIGNRATPAAAPSSIPPQPSDQSGYAARVAASPALRTERPSSNPARVGS